MTRNLFLIGMIVVVLIILIGSYASFIGVKQLSESIENRQEISRELSTTQNFLSKLKDGETGQRGYIITGKEEYLEPYYQALAFFRSPDTQTFIIDEENSPQFSQRFKELDRLTKQKLDELQDRIDARKTQGFTEAQKQVSDDTGRKLMDQIRVVVQSITDDKENLIHQGDAAVEKRLLLLFTLIPISSLIAFSIVGLCLYALNRDIQNRIKLENELMRLNSIQQVILDSARQGIISLDLSGRIKSFNKGAETQFGYKPNEVINMRMVNLLDEIDNTPKVLMLSEKYKQPFQNPIEVLKYLSNNNIRDDVEWIIKNKSGRKFPLIFSATSLIDSDKLIIGYLLVASSKPEQTVG